MYKDLSLKEKAKVLQYGGKLGLTSVEAIAKLYDEAISSPKDPPIIQKANKSKADFMQRLKDPNREYIRDWENSDNIATHKLSYEEDPNGNTFVFPYVQRIKNGSLVDFSRPPYMDYVAPDRAMEVGDTVRMTPEEAEWFTTHYKDYYPGFNEYQKGGSIHIKHPGRLTALKKRTGKTEAELWATGNKDYRRMINFARQARKWHHKDSGGYLNNIPVTYDGYKKYSVDEVPYLYIPSNSITMKGLPYNNRVPILGEGVPSGRRQIMVPGVDYLFEGDYGVVEHPLQEGGHMPFFIKHLPEDSYIRTVHENHTPQAEQNVTNYDFTGTTNRVVNNDNLNYINQALDTVPYHRRAALLGTIINESGGNPRAVDASGNFIGLFQMSNGQRYTFPDGYENMTDYELIDDQLQKTFVNTINNTIDRMSWTHGGSGSGYQSGKAAMQDYYNSDSVAGATKALNYGYIRPRDRDAATRNRIDTAEKVYDIINNQHKYGGLIKPFSYQKTPAVRYQNGGYFNQWRNLNQQKQDYFDSLPIVNEIAGIGRLDIPQVEVTADAPRPGDANYDRYIANTYDAWQRGDVDINTLPTETRNRVRGYSGAIVTQNALNEAGQVLFPYVISLATPGIGALTSIAAGEAINSIVNNSTQGRNETWGQYASDRLGIENPYGQIAMEFTNPAFWPGYIYGGMNVLNKAARSKTLGTLQIANQMKRDLRRNKNLDAVLSGLDSNWNITRRPNGSLNREASVTISGIPSVRQYNIANPRDYADITFDRMRIVNPNKVFYSKIKNYPEYDPFYRPGNITPPERRGGSEYSSMFDEILLDPEADAINIGTSSFLKDNVLHQNLVGTHELIHRLNWIKFLRDKGIKLSDLEEVGFRGGKLYDKSYNTPLRRNLRREYKDWLRNYDIPGYNSNFGDDMDDYLYGTEAFARTGQLFNFFGLREGNKITPDMIRFAKNNLVNMTGFDNNMTQFLNRITNPSKFAKWANKNAGELFVIPAVGVGLYGLQKQIEE